MADQRTGADTAKLEEAWRRSLGPGGHPELAACRALAERLIHGAEPFKAYDVVRQGLEEWPGDVHLRQLHGYSLTQTGAPREAYAVFKALYGEGHRDGETLGMLARACKELGRLDEAFTCYDEGYRVATANDRVDDAYYTGINAATTALLLGRRAAARARAADVRDNWVSRSSGYWAEATLGEAALLHADLSTAATHYRAAVREAGKRHAHVASMAKQARAVMAALGRDASELESIFRLPAVVVFSGHMIDAADRKEPRFPPELEAGVTQRLCAELEALNAGIGYCAAACGGDLLFIEAMHAREGEVHITLPCPPDEFRARSVAFAGEEWNRRFDAALEQAADVLVASGERALDNPLSFEYANRLMLGRACLHASSLAGEAKALAVWNGAAGDGAGGTATAIERWRARDLEVHVLHPREKQASAPAGSDGAAESAADQIEGTDGPGAPKPLAKAGPGAPKPSAEAGDVRFEFASILFADAVGFSKLNERQVREFTQLYLGAIAELVQGCEQPPTACNTWGDGLYMVFRTPEAAGRFALDLVDLVVNTPWSQGQAELPDDLNIRVALHTGPTYAMTDPLTGRPTYMGSHVSQAARIEPITPPGHVYASGAFAAMAAADGITSFVCEYSGRVPLAKGYGTFPLYHVRWA